MRHIETVTYRPICNINGQNQFLNAYVGETIILRLEITELSREIVK
jgi:hypothetical protein